MINKNIAHERVMMQLADIQTYVESIEDMLRDTRKSIVQDLDLIATELMRHEYTVDFSTTDCGDIYVPTMEQDDE